LSNPPLVRVVQEAIDEGSSLAELERTLLADREDDVAAAWLYAWAYDAVRPSGDRLAARTADGVRSGG